MSVSRALQSLLAKPELTGSLLARVRERAIDVGMSMAQRTFANRKGHGHSPTVSERHMGMPELAALLAIGFEKGVEAHLRGDLDVVDRDRGRERHQVQDPAAGVLATRVPSSGAPAEPGAQRTGEAVWLQACLRQGWNEASRVALLERFVRDRGLMVDLGAAAQGWADSERGDFSSSMSLKDRREALRRLAASLAQLPRETRCALLDRLFPDFSQQLEGASVERMAELMVDRLTECFEIRAVRHDANGIPLASDAEPREWAVYRHPLVGQDRASWVADHPSRSGAAGGLIELYAEAFQVAGEVDAPADEAHRGRG